MLFFARLGIINSLVLYHVKEGYDERFVQGKSG